MVSAALREVSSGRWFGFWFGFLLVLYVFCLLLFVCIVSVFCLLVFCLIWFGFVSLKQMKNKNKTAPLEHNKQLHWLKHQTEGMFFLRKRLGKAEA